MTDARIILWGTDIAAVSWDESREAAVFQYDPDFLNSQIEISPIHLPLRSGTFQFGALPKETFRGLPGLLSDCLPDKFGNQLIDAWLVRQGRSLDSFNPVERLCYLGSRGMGALEFQPTLSTAPNTGEELQIDELVRLANQVVTERSELQGSLKGTDEDAETLQDILRVGTSAGGARAKAILAWNEATGEFRSGQVDAANGFAPWILKFDGIHNNRDKELADPKGYGRVEYAYHLMARDAGIEMSRCRVHEENGRAHFMTRRFDRDENNRKLHMASLCGLMHYDFHMAGSYSYEQAIQTMQTLGLPRHDLDQQLRRATFNVMARNQDDHVKNIAFLMDRSGTWRLSPAYDVTYSYNPNGPWTSQHQMTLNGKRDGFTMDDLVTFANFTGMKTRRAKSIIEEVRDAVNGWTAYAEQAEIPPQDAARIGRVHRLEW